MRHDCQESNAVRETPAAMKEAMLETNSIQQLAPASFPQRDYAEGMEKIFHILLDQSITTSGGAITWYAPADDLPQSSSPALAGPHLYDGLCGIALFLAAHHSVTSEPEARKKAIGAILPLRLKLANMAATPAQMAGRQLALGGFVGLGAFIYTFVQLSQFLAEPEILKWAEDVLPLLSPERIVADQKFDVMSGCAGTLLALLQLARQPAVSSSSRERAIELAMVCAEHLLAQRTAHGKSPRAWASPGCPPLSGFAHGASGISFALLRLHEHSARTEHREAALEGFAFERSLYLPQARTWLDLRFNRPLEQSAWCHGAPGMALARAAIHRQMDAAEISDDIEQALSIMTPLPHITEDHLCCGNIGCVEIACMLAQALGRPAMRQAGYELASRTLQEANSENFLVARCEQPSERPLFNPSMFRGLSGVGYTLVRLLYPDRFPCLLLMD
jgi:lantibiotic modifying enzyme